MPMLIYTEGSALLAEPNPDLGAGGEAVVPKKCSIQGMLLPVCSSAPSCLEELGGKNRPHCHPGQAVLRTMWQPGWGKKKHFFPQDPFLQAVKGTGTQYPWETTGGLYLSLASDTSPSSTSLPQTPSELGINTARLETLNTSKQHAVQGFQKASLEITCTLMRAADKAKEKQRSRHPSS